MLVPLDGHQARASTHQWSTSHCKDFGRRPIFIKWHPFVGELNSIPWIEFNPGVSPYHCAVMYHLVRNFVVIYLFFGISTLRVPCVRTYVRTLYWTFSNISRIGRNGGNSQNSVQPNSLGHKLAYKMDMYNAV
jgi:hypothetical protein